MQAHIPSVCSSFLPLADTAIVCTPLGRDDHLIQQKIIIGIIILIIQTYKQHKSLGTQAKCNEGAPWLLGISDRARW